MSKPKQFVYIAQRPKETVVCKIGITDNLDRRLKDYNSRIGTSKDNLYKYLFTCEVKNINKRRPINFYG